MDIIYVVEEESGDYDEVSRNVRYAGLDKDKAFERASVKTKIMSDTYTIYLSIWKNGEEIGRITRYSNTDTWKRVRGNTAAFRVFGIYLNAKGEQLSPDYVEMMKKIRGELDKVFKPDSNSMVADSSGTITQIHEMLANEGF